MILIMNNDIDNTNNNIAWPGTRDIKGLFEITVGELRVKSESPYRL